ncbi:MAG: radical SAM protein [Lachnospiraceae bacterium]|nr:radical SAM protein [Lachnospiraceae bacterium]
MDIRDIFVMNAREGALFINPWNAEMLAVKKKDIQEAVRVLSQNIKNESCEAFLEPITEEMMIKPKIDSAKGIGIIPTLKCNFACKYCYERNFEKSEMTPEMIPYIRKFVEYWNREMNCNSTIEDVGLLGGEVLRSDTHELMNAIMEEFAEAKCHITTNGVSLLEYKELLQKYRPSMTISLDGTEKMQAEKRETKIEDAYKRIVDGIHFLTEEDLEIVIATVYNPDFPVEEYAKFFDMLEELGWHENEKMQVNFSLEMECGINGCEKEKHLKVLQEFRKLLREERRACSVRRGILPGMSGMKRILKEKCEKGTVDLVRCSANASDGLIFAPDGYVYNCNLIKTEKNRIGQFYPSMNIYREVVEEHINRSILSIPECKECKMALFCRGGCPASAITKGGNLGKGFCGVWKEEEILKEADMFINVDELFSMARQFEE